MRPFTALTAIAAPIDLANVDTDRIIPARFLRMSRTTDYGRFLFHDLRFDADGAERAEFVLNQPAYRDAKILVTAANFGCGSSREMAVWALDAYGIRVVIAPSLGDIFHENCLKNGVLPLLLPEETTAALRRTLHECPGAVLSVDLDAQTVTGPTGACYPFDIDPVRKEMLRAGTDDVQVTLAYEPQIAAFEREHAREWPWHLTAGSIAVLGAGALRQVRTVAGARRAALTVYDESRGLARWVAVDADGPTRLPAGGVFPLELLGELAPLRRGEVKVVDVSAVLHLEHARALQSEGVAYFLAVPMLVEGRLVGSLNVPVGSPSQCDARVVDTARAAAAHLAAAAELARLDALQGR